MGVTLEVKLKYKIIADRRPNGLDCEPTLPVLWDKESGDINDFQA